MSNVRIKVTRGDEEQGRRMEEFLVPFVEGMSLLDALFWIRERKDQSLAVRYSCRSANACKECMAMVDGQTGYLCSIRAVEGSSVAIGPLPNRPWIKDLTTSIE